MQSKFYAKNRSLVQKWKILYYMFENFIFNNSLNCMYNIHTKSLNVLNSNALRWSFDFSVNKHLSTIISVAK